MDALFGVAGKNYVVLACDTMYRNNILVPKSDHNKCVEINDKAAVISGGNLGDCARVIGGVLEGIKYESIAHGLVITEQVFASALQMEIHNNLRKSPVDVTSIIGGLSEGVGKLYMIDQYGACSSYKYMATGYCSPFFLTKMKMCHTEETPVEETVELLKEIYEGIKKRLVLNYGILHFCIITEDGIKQL
ncbi:20S proteasome subunit beta 4 [Nematocida sp. ERTm5]|nr:20S proteasome subunit beta 4 [Nematocida sp. AWRm79]KAI5183800.1 20S proteasome subunit beta 4 [Nematocida sp. AWRm78]OAG33736.1 20S proteasome subunit beta 4 [Nematocida sp. ERTm5]